MIIFQPIITILVLFTDAHIFLTYNDNQAILVNFNKPSIKSTAPEKLSKRDPKFQVIYIFLLVIFLFIKFLII